MLQIQKLSQKFRGRTRHTMLFVLAALFGVSATLPTLLLSPRVFAATNVTVTVHRANSSGTSLGVLSGAQVQIARESGVSSCASSATSNGSGQAIFSGCNSSTWYVINNVTYPGYYYAEHLTQPDWNFQTAASGTTNITVYLVANPPQILNFSVSPTTIQSGGATTVSWLTNYTNSCTASGAPGWSGTKALAGTQPLSNLTASATLTLTCSGAGGSTSKTAAFTVSAPPTPAPTTPPASSAAPKSPTTTKSPTTSKPKTTPAPAPAIVGTAGDTTPPSKLKSLEAKSDKGTVLLSWPESDGAEGVVGYSVERSLDGLEWNYIAQNLQETSFVDKDVEPDTYYFYRVRAVDEAGNQSEAIFSEAVLSASTAAATSRSESTKKDEGKQASSPGPVIGVAIFLVVLAVGAGVWFLRRRSAQMNGLYDYDTVVQQPQRPTQALGQTDHTGQSLKDMVLKDYHPNDSEHKSGPPPHA